MTKRQYIEYLLATPGNYTCTNLADHLEGEQAHSHDAISDFLRHEKLTPRGLWQIVQPLLHDGPQSYLIFDDSVQDKRYSHKIELVKLQYSGIAPVVKASGNSRMVQRRFARPLFLHQSFMEYSDLSLRHCAWAKAFYRQQRDKGKGHYCAVRALAFKWIRIIFRCWKDRIAYDDEKYLESLRRRRSPLSAHLQPAV